MSENNEDTVHVISKDSENHVGMNNIIKESVSTKANKIVDVSSSVEDSTIIAERDKDHKDEAPTTFHPPAEVEQTSATNITNDAPISSTATEQEIEKEKRRGERRKAQ